MQNEIIKSGKTISGRDITLIRENGVVKNVLVKESQLPSSFLNAAIYERINNIRRILN